MTEQTWGDVEKEYIEAEESARRLGLKFVGNEYIAEEEMDDDWVRLIDVAPILNEYETLKADKRLLMHVVHGRAMASSLPKHLKEE